MSDPLHDTNLWTLVEALLGTRRTETLFAAVRIPPALRGPRRPRVARAELAMALNLLLFEDLLQRVGPAQAYLGDRCRDGGQVWFDHGALRTVKAPSGALPEGAAGFTRILEPLGYREAARYPLDKLGMTGRALVQEDLPEELPQFFLSELHPERFSAGFQAAVARTLAESRDPLPVSALASLAELAGSGSLSLDQALRLLPNLTACFQRQHPPALLADYQTLLAESEEMAWIATEGNAFNHVTDRVEDLLELTRDQLAKGRPMKERVEVSGSGRVLQTAFRAVRVERPLVSAEGHLELVAVPGSFFEFITRKPLADGRLDLSFDTGNAQAIFKMTGQAGR